MPKIQDYYKASKHYLTKKQCVWFVCHILYQHDTYHTEILEEILKYPKYTTSVCLVNTAIKDLIRLKVINSYTQPLSGRGKARKMYRLSDNAYAIAKDWSNLWIEFVNK